MTTTLRTLRLVASHGGRASLIPTTVAGSSRGSASIGSVSVRVFEAPKHEAPDEPLALDESLEFDDSREISLLRREYREWRWANSMHARHLGMALGKRTEPDCFLKHVGVEHLSALVTQPSDAPLTRACGRSSDPRHMFLDFELLGRGGFGTVLAATCVHDGRRYALKLVPFDEKSESATLAEAAIMATLPPHPNLIRCHESWVVPNEVSWEELVDSEGVCTDDHGSSSASIVDREDDEQASSADDDRSATPLERLLVLQLELCEMPTLHASLLGSRIAAHIRWRWVEGLAAALHALHSAGFVHNDVKPLNIFCCPKTGGAKLADFGCCARKGAHGFSCGGTALYAAPERRLSSGLGPPMLADAASDIYSAGVCAAEVCGEFATAMERAKIVSQLHASSMGIAGVVAACATATRLLPCCAEGELLVRAMLHHSPVHRPSATEVADRAHALVEAALSAAMPSGHDRSGATLAGACA